MVHRTLQDAGFRHFLPGEAAGADLHARAPGGPPRSAGKFLAKFLHWCSGCAMMLAHITAKVHRVVKDAYRVAEAARVFGISKDTVKRRLREGTFPNATRSGPLVNSPWVIPHRDLLAAGFTPVAVDPASGTSEAGSVASVAELQGEVGALRARVETLEAELLRLRTQVLEERNDALTRALETLVEREGA